VAYNLDIFEVFVVSIPRVRRVAGYVVGVSVLAGLLTAGAVAVGTDVGLSTELGVFGDAELPTPLVLVAAFAVAALVGGETTQLLVPSYPRNWGYFLALVCLAVAGVLVPAATVVGGATDSSPAPVWFALGSVFLFSSQVLVISDDIPGAWRQLPASAVQPALLFAGLTAATPLSLSVSTHTPYIAVLVGAAVGLVAVSGFAEVLMRSNVSEVRAFEITSHLVQREPLHLGMGVTRSVPVQTFAVETADGRTRVAAPWVHPGILERIGGAKLTPNVLGALNNTAGEGTNNTGDERERATSNTAGPDSAGESARAVGGEGRPDSARGDGGGNIGGEQGFFWHIPSTHLSDSPDPRVHERVLGAVGDPETTSVASQLVSRTYNETTFHGRRYGEKRVVFVESDEYADIEADIFGEVIDPERTLVVDRHVRVADTPRSEVHTDAPDAETLRVYLREFLSVLDEQPLSEYRAGDAVDIDVEGISLYALVEEVNGQRTACVAADRNERPHALVDARKQLDRFDEVLLFTTDTHASVTENRFDPQTRPDQIRTLVETAAAEVADAEAGLTADSAEVELMRGDYSRLMFSLNILARVYIVSLAGLYVLLALGLVLV
jgi:putative membrane protein